MSFGELRVGELSIRPVVFRRDVFSRVVASRGEVLPGKILWLIFNPVLSTRSRQEPKPATTKNKHFKLLNIPEISDLSTLLSRSKDACNSRP